MACLVTEQPVAELGVVSVGIKQGVGQIRLLEIAVGDRCGEPAVVGLSREPEDPARHRDGDPVGGELCSRAGRAFSRQVRLGQVRRRAAQDLDLLLKQPVAAAEQGKTHRDVQRSPKRILARRFYRDASLADRHGEQLGLREYASDWFWQRPTLCIEWPRDLDQIDREYDRYHIAQIKGVLMATIKRLIAVTAVSMAALTVTAPSALAYVPRWQVTKNISSEYSLTVYYCAASGGGGAVLQPGVTAQTDVCSFTLPGNREVTAFDANGPSGTTLIKSIRNCGADRRIYINTDTDTQYTAYVTLYPGRCD